MIRHHRVQMMPVHVRAMFCVSESFSAGRKKSLTPASTIDHCRAFPSALQSVSRRPTIGGFVLWGGGGGGGLGGKVRTFITGALTIRSLAVANVGRRELRPHTCSPEVHRLNANGAIPEFLEHCRLRCGIDRRSVGRLIPSADWPPEGRAH